MADDMDKEFANAIGSEWWTNTDDANRAMGTVACHAHVWRSRASHWRGKCEGMAETVAYLKARVETLEARESAPAAYLRGAVDAFNVLHGDGPGGATGGVEP